VRLGAASGEVQQISYFSYMALAILVLETRAILNRWFR
jgi:hypothetical protein